MGQNASKRVALTYIKNTAEMTARLLRQHNTMFAYKPTNTLRRTLSRPKGKLDPTAKKNVIYRIECKDCDKRSKVGLLVTTAFNLITCMGVDENAALVSTSDDLLTDICYTSECRIERGRKRQRSSKSAATATSSANFDKVIDLGAKSLYSAFNLITCMGVDENAALVSTSDDLLTDICYTSECRIERGRKRQRSSKSAATATSSANFDKVIDLGAKSLYSDPSIIQYTKDCLAASSLPRRFLVDQSSEVYRLIKFTGSPFKPSD
ncbi:hypothetical protein T265_00421 [Opisthorchis viverrini]|uniref:Uncharacterized protein n=1 Tax=Opisthorchis viverrini TaxID=6198 RepID=A0A075ACQ5_OPIVI|nr:hypothetical protein T265_00421 [Opisthorchis viverrini]KER33735.1 hypothetical protein T265_00421 [Opisthorchis viverrini]